MAAQSAIRRLEVVSAHLFVVDPADQTVPLVLSDTAAAAARLNFAKPVQHDTAFARPAPPSLHEMRIKNSALEYAAQTLSAVAPVPSALSRPTAHYLEGVAGASRQALEPLPSVQGAAAGDRSLAPVVRGSWGSSSWKPKVNVLDQGHGYAVDVALPGIRPGDLRLELRNSELLISGVRLNRAAYDTARVLVRELANGPFQVALALPPNGDTASMYADYENGLLRIRFRKRQALAA